MTKRSNFPRLVLAECKGDPDRADAGNILHMVLTIQIGTTTTTLPCNSCAMSPTLLNGWPQRPTRIPLSHSSFGSS